MIKIIKRPLLNQGMICHDDNGNAVILIDNEQSIKEQDKTLWHELVHLILAQYGIVNHDEEKIEAIAENLNSLNIRIF